MADSILFEKRRDTIFSNAKNVDGLISLWGGGFWDENIYEGKVEGKINELVIDDVDKIGVSSIGIEYVAYVWTDQLVSVSIMWSK